MLNQEATTNILRQFNDFWIEPEIARRKEAGLLPEDFKIVEYLIKLPKDGPPIVQFNEEVDWIATAKRGDRLPFTPGDPIFLHEIDQIEDVEPPEVDGKRVAYAYFFWNGSGYEGNFDFSPNHPDYGHDEAVRQWVFGKHIASHLQTQLQERAINVYDGLADQLQQIGLWAVPALLPYPLVQIARLVDEGNLEEAHQTLIKFCSTDFLTNLVNGWWNVEAFQLRKQLIEEALFAHENQKYHLSIFTLLPQAEGIITDWYFSLNLNEASTPFRAESKTKKFRDLVLQTQSMNSVYRRVVEDTSKFMLDGPVLATFKAWQEKIDVSFPNRHVLGHGRYEAALHTEENSIKVFLLLDALYQMIAAREMLLQRAKENVDGFDSPP